MSAKHTKERSTQRRRTRGEADLRRLREMDEAQIQATSPAELADLPADFWDDAEVVVPPGKDAVSLRIDRDVLEWFRAQGPRYQTRMNAVLRSYMKAAGSRRG